MKNIFRPVIWGIVLACQLGFVGITRAESGSSPFWPGEKLTYTLRWGVIHAGEATLEVLPVKDINGVRACHFVMTARTNSFIDTFYKVRDRIDAYADANMTRSVFYTKKQKEGSHKRDIAITFDWERNQARYSNFGKAKNPIALIPGTFDPLSAFYYTRLTDLKEDLVVECPVTDGKKNVMGTVRVIRRETIEVAGGTFDTYLLEPDMRHVGGVFKKSNGAKLHVWVSADNLRIPIKIKSKVAIGSFVGELVSARAGYPVRGDT